MEIENLSISFKEDRIIKMEIEKLLKFTYMRGKITRLLG